MLFTDEVGGVPDGGAVLVVGGVLKVGVVSVSVGGGSEGRHCSMSR